MVGAMLVKDFAVNFFIEAINVMMKSMVLSSL